MNQATRIFQFIFNPLLNRVKLGEGGIVGLNLAHSVFAGRSTAYIAIEFTISLLTLCVLYGFNDLVDRFIDLQNKKKDKPFVQSIIDHAKLFHVINVVLMLALLAAAYFLLGLPQVVAMVLLFAVNAAYSLRLKATAIGDVVAVILWGGLFVAISTGNNYMLALLAGVMTGMAHVFQMLDDKDADGQTHTATSVVAMPGIEKAMLLVLTLAWAALLWFAFGSFSCVITAIPILVYLVWLKVQPAWYIARLCFVTCWVMVLYNLYGGF